MKRARAAALPVSSPTAWSNTTAPINTRKGKAVFIREFMRAVTKDALARVHAMPAAWDARELREFLADDLNRERSMVPPRAWRGGGADGWRRAGLARRRRYRADRETVLQAGLKRREVAP